MYAFKVTVWHEKHSFVTYCTIGNVGALLAGYRRAFGRFTSQVAICDYQEYATHTAHTAPILATGRN